MQDDKKAKVSDIRKLLNDGSTQKKKQKGSAITQKATGSGNIQVAGNVGRITIKEEKKIVKKVVGPAPGTIGANPTLKNKIESMINELGLRREKRFGKKAYPVIRSNLKKDFGIPKTEKWTIVWDWPESRASELINYFAEKLDNTIDGRINIAAQRASYKHTRGQLFRLEKKYLDLLGLKQDSPEVRNARETMFGSPSRKDLTDSQFRNWVEVLENNVRKMYGDDF